MKTLRKHQLEGKDFIHKGQYLGVLLYHGMGLGKTLTTLSYVREKLAELRSKGVRNPKFIVVVPKSATITWQAECQAEAPDLVRDMIIVPYSQLNKAPKLIMYHDVRIVVLDESHKVKTPDTNRARDLAAMFAHLDASPGKFKYGKVIFLSGTPMENHAGEIYTTWAVCASPSAQEASLRLLDEKRYEKWGQTFAQRKEKHWKEGGREKKGSTWEGIANADYLKQLLDPIVHYKRVSDCLDLPDKLEFIIDLNLPDDKLLKDANLEEPEAYMALLERLARAKTPYLLSWVDDFLKNGKEQLVVFATYKFPVQELQEKFPHQVVLVTGEQSTDERNANIQAFQQGKKRVIALTYKAGSDSLNLQNAHFSIYMGYPWHQASIDQAMARTFRSGQTETTRHYFMMSGYNDMRIKNLVKLKGDATKTLEDHLHAADKERLEKEEEISLDFFL